MNISDNGAKIFLTINSQDRLQIKNFSEEIRAKLDIDNLVNKAVILLDLKETRLEDIFTE